ncbi:type III-A CRISPR-associated protein Cas10/Csm1 [Tepidimicrobium xylanilyticum]|uniref:type III-A CRISPR-associated protein Cas10/Csm1 n=1 Tax=Tepidimicrobium xylanilyticum TaxID=1123352 RepID=UPI002650F6ED|nr:type III-A CRISPR-associated protein Cas10/Csm1 [Tepidimicrobium xylanilyticum]GMG97781.1 type III-A CRISPR-associated protein Cas10/Csm1 [Tepidimicrobium xylanilyticum]
MIDNYHIALAVLYYGLEKVISRVGIPIKNSVLNSIRKYMEDERVRELILAANKLALGIENVDDESNKESYNRRLYSIFQNINIGKEYEIKNYYYPLVPMNISDDIFPIEEEKIGNSKLKHDYLNLIKELEEDIERELGHIETLNLGNIKRVYNKIYYILEKYTTFIPNTVAKSSDISLFEAIKTTSAIATSLNEYHKDGQQQENKFILLAGDVSGIQSFIYQVTEGEDTKENVSKNLRGKSFYVNVLIDFMSKYIINELNVTIANILYCGGGTFQILLPNTKMVKERLIEIESRIQKYLYDKYRARLGLVLVSIEIDEDGIINYSDALTKLQNKLSESKYQKFLKIIESERDDFFLRDDGIVNDCIYCYQHKATVDGIMCEECNTHINLGGKLIKDGLKYIVYDFDNEIEKCDVKVSFGPMGQVCFYMDLENSDIGFIVENINGKGEFGRSKFVGNIVPLKGGVVASFNDIALLAEGDKKIGVLKMDIDNLGTIFSVGFDEDNKSISRISTLSRMIDLFFCGYINKICEDLYEEYRSSKEKEELILDNLFYINFSGGDDLVIIGPWDWIIKLAIRIKEKLSEYTCFNPNISISGGIYIDDSKTPVRITLNEGENCLDGAKNHDGKDALYIFGQSFSWAKGKYNVNKLVRDGEEYEKWIVKKYLSRSLAHNIMVGSKNIKRKGILDFDLIPQIAYSLSRNIENDTIKNNIIGRLITPRIEDSEIEFVKYPLMFALMKTREIKEDQYE